MQPAARIAAAIDVLDAVYGGQAVEQALTRWGRQNRYAGSKDRAAVRDHVFEAVRLKSIGEHLGKGQTGRALMLGVLRHQGVDVSRIFTGEGHAPAPLSDAERAPQLGRPDIAQMWNIPEWLMPRFSESLGEKAEQTALLSTERAPITLRVNRLKADRDGVKSELDRDGIICEDNPLSPTALTVTQGARRVRQSSAYLEGRVELQDAASQAVVDLLPQKMRCLDFCAGGGGKALAMSAQAGREVFAHDENYERMKDLLHRAKRAGADITLLTGEQLDQQAPFDLILCDAPCSGSGAWRRSPEGKWRLTPDRLAELTSVQDDILRRVVDLLAPGGCIVYVTCSVLRSENEDRIKQFEKSFPRCKTTLQKRFNVSEHGDGFFTAHLTQE